MGGGEAVGLLGDSDALVDLSPRQQQTLAYLAMGRTLAEIAVELGISPRTARLHADAVRAKLGIRRIREAPMAYRLLTGRDPLQLAVVGAPARQR